MRLFGQQIVRATCRARYTNPTTISVRRLAGTRPTYDSSRGSPGPKASDHSAESYFKDVDSSPPPDSSTYQVDHSSDAVQRPHHPPSGEFSKAGVGSEEYRMVDKQTPYDPPSPSGAGKKLRYGGKSQWAPEKGGETGRSGEGPEGVGAAGRKPEGKQ